jgi:hypothetical protein
LQLELTVQVRVQLELRADAPERRISRTEVCKFESSHCVRQLAENRRSVIVEYTLVIEFSLDQVPQESVVDIRIFVTLLDLRGIVCLVKIAFRIVDQSDSVTAFRGLSPTLTLRCDDTNG